MARVVHVRECSRSSSDGGRITWGVHDAVCRVREHKLAFRRYLSELLVKDGYPESWTESIFLLAEGVMVAAAIHGNAATRRPEAGHRRLPRLRGRPNKTRGQRVAAPIVVLDGM
ncbi:hypothetical protein MOQ72_28545 [Saccharopolyspora sp. K220]|uniref:hypothetical protein n=1 Tax=Saccharopolyspora soli TaxID=2926618 RepID=UPI001F56F4EB|nr:hypothetical protein [Saccharopolyspora soli]MCI2421392.1 hypothetical protein [Saccharopolyspora soli]